jgi:hypothetical protein
MVGRTLTGAVVAVGVDSRIQLVRDIRGVQSMIRRFMTVTGACRAIWILSVGVMGAMVAVRVDAGIKLVSNVRVVRAVVCGVSRCSMVVEVRVVLRIEFVSCFRLMRPVVG